MSSALLSEGFIQDAFHQYLTAALTQAKAEHLIDDDPLRRSEENLMITGNEYPMFQMSVNWVV